jgi:hypothetical protein
MDIFYPGISITKKVYGNFRIRTITAISFSSLDVTTSNRLMGAKQKWRLKSVRNLAGKEDKSL